jgi:hypothetical protein
MRDLRTLADYTDDHVAMDDLAAGVAEVRQFVEEATR